MRDGAVLKDNLADRAPIGCLEILELRLSGVRLYVFFFQAEDGIRDLTVTGVQTCALPILIRWAWSRTSRFGRPPTSPLPAARQTFCIRLMLSGAAQRAAWTCRVAVHREIGRASCRERV